MNRAVVEALLDAEYGPTIARRCDLDGCKMESTGGCNCGCEWTDDHGEVNRGQCSVPVNVCAVCGDCDYADNDEAREKRERCRARRADA